MTLSLSPDPDGKLTISGVGSGTQAREPIRVAFDYFKAHSSRISAFNKPGEKNFHLHIVDLNNNGHSSSMTLPCFLALCSGLMARPVLGSLVGDIPTIPGELFAKFQTSFYADTVDAVFKGLGVE